MRARSLSDSDLIYCVEGCTGICFVLGPENPGHPLLRDCNGSRFQRIRLRFFAPRVPTPVGAASASACFASSRTAMSDRLLVSGSLYYLPWRNNVWQSNSSPPHRPAAVCIEAGRSPEVQVFVAGVPRDPVSCAGQSPGSAAWKRLSHASDESSTTWISRAGNRWRREITSGRPMCSGIVARPAGACGRTKEARWSCWKANLPWLLPSQPPGCRHVPV